MKFRILLLAFSLAVPACQAKPFLTRPSLEDEGAVFLYVRPFPQEAERLSFSLERIEAVREDGSAVPLTLRFKELKGPDVRRERFLAHGVLAPGRYKGFRIKASTAALKGEEERASLEVSEDPPGIDAPFLMRRAQAVVFALEFRYHDSVSAGFRFTPVFSAEVPSQPAAGAIGVASSRGMNTVTVFDKVSGRVSGVIPTGREPSGMALSEARRRAYVAIPGEDRVDVLDLFENGVIDHLRMKSGDIPVEVALTPDGRTLLTANSGSNTVSLIDPAALFETNRVSVGSRPRSVLVDPSGRRAFVFNEFSNTISLIDIPSGTVASTVATESAPIRGQFNRDRSRLFVIHRNSPYLTVWNPSSLSLIRRVYVGTGATALTLDSRTDRIYLGRGSSPTIDVYDPSAFLPVDFLPSGGDVSFLTVEREQNLLCAVLSDLNVVRMVRLVGRRTEVEVDVGEDPYWVSFLGER